MKVEGVERNAYGIECECGGYAARVNCTEEEINKFGCGHESTGYECCARAFVCKICGKRHAGYARAPEIEY